MDTGFGAVLDRFEKAFGKLATNLVLALIGLATATACCSVIWKLALGPAVAWLSSISFGVDRIGPILEVAWYAGGFAFGFAAVSFASWRFDRRKQLEAVRAMKAETQKMIADTNVLEERVRSFEKNLEAVEAAQRGRKA